MQTIKEVRKLAKGLGISLMKKSRGKLVSKSVEDLQREIHKKIVKQQAQISKEFVKTCRQVMKSVRSTGARKPQRQARVPRFEPQMAVLTPPRPPAPKPPPPPPPPPPLKKGLKKSTPKLGLREQLMKELKNKVEKGKIKRLS